MRFVLVWLGWSLTAYTSLTSLAAAQVGHERVGVPLPVLGVGGERFAAVNVVVGENVRVVVSNVVNPTAEAKANACPLVIRFFDSKGALIGGEHSLAVAAGESGSVAGASQAGLIRAIVSVENFSDPKKICAVKTALELFDVRTGATRLVIPSEVCLGNAACGAPINPP